MELKNYFATDEKGNLMPMATCYLYEAGTETLAGGIEDINGNPLANPFGVGASALIQLAAPDGIYDLRVVKGSRDYRLRVQFGDIPAAIQQVEAIAADAAGSAAAASESAASAADAAESKVAVLRSDLANATDPAKGAGMLGFTHGKPGAVGRSGASKLQEQPTPADYGAVADWNGSSGADNKVAFDKLLAAHDVVFITPGRWRCGSKLTVPAGKVLIGAGGEIVFTTGSLEMGANTKAIEVFVSGNGKTNAGSGYSMVAGAENVTLIRPKVREVQFNAVDNSGGIPGLKVIDPDFDDIGGAGIVPTYQGCGVYSSGDGTRVVGGEIQRTRGEAAVFINGGDDQSVCGVYIHDTFYRAVELFNNPTGVSVCQNTIRRTGEINDTGSGVGCNGIYSIVAHHSDAMIAGNDIEDCAENGIEGNGTIISNKIKRTGYRNLTTPSKEGIFLNTSAVCHDNVIDDAAGDGIKAFASVGGNFTDVCGNTIRNPAGAGITIQVDGIGVVHGKLNVERNTIHGENAPEKHGVNILRSNGAEFDKAKSFVRHNTVYGRSTNFVSSFVGNVEGNSFDPTLASFGDATGTASKARRFTMIFSSPLTTTRAALANTTNPAKGDILRVVRTSAATGAFNINVTGSSGAIKGLSAAGQWAEVEYDGSAWVLTAYGSL